jgi:hypothetical protein
MRIVATWLAKEVGYGEGPADCSMRRLEIFELRCYILVTLLVDHGNASWWMLKNLKRIPTCSRAWMMIGWMMGSSEEMIAVVCLGRDWLLPAAK